MIDSCRAIFLAISWPEQITAVLFDVIIIMSAFILDPHA
jgi:hypothetical protein